MKYEISEISSKLDTAHEISDGLFAFAAQAKHAIDCAIYYVDDDAFYVVDEYEFTHEKLDAPEAYNISEIANVHFNDYKRVSQVVYTTREEMHAHIVRFMTEKNHF